MLCSIEAEQFPSHFDQLGLTIKISLHLLPGLLLLLLPHSLFLLQSLLLQFKLFQLLFG